MLKWNDAVIAEVEAALEQARAGRPCVLVVEGESGMGKSSLLAEITARAVDFRTTVVEAAESAEPRIYGVLAQLGVGEDQGDGGSMVTPTAAAQAFRAVLDEDAHHGPTCVVLDDLQWSDPESINALVEVGSHLNGDPVLFVIGTRPLEPHQFPSWQRWVDQRAGIRRIRLTGLAMIEAIEFVQDMRPDVSPELAEALWHHTAGHPLYLRSVVAEYSGSELAEMGVLPAPMEFVRALGVRIGRVSSAAQDLAKALGVLGLGWTSVRDVALVAGVEEPAASVQELIELGVVEVRFAAAGDLVRPAHALVRAAILQSTSLVERRRLHARAATVVTLPSAVLAHRLAATDRHDDALAADLETHALALHGRRAYRQAAHYLTAASGVTSDLAARRRRWLQSLFETLLSGDHATVHAAVADIEQAEDDVRREFLLGALAQWERRPFEALAHLRPLSGLQTVDPDVETGFAPLTPYRIEVMLAWAGLFAGAPEDEIAQALKRAAALGVEDPALRRYARLISGQLAARHINDPRELPGLGDLPERPTAVPVSATEMLAWRGTVRSVSGRFAEAITDLDEVVQRIQRGQHEPAGGSFHAMLGHAQWFVGEWAMARVNFRMAASLSGAHGQPVVQAVLPLLAAGEGRVGDADSDVENARAIVRQTPWLEAVNLLTVSDIVRRHAAGPSANHLDYVPLHDAVAAVRAGSARRPLLWMAHVALAAVWNGDQEDAGFCAGAIADAPVGWAAGIGHWLQGLIAESVGDGRAALGRLRAAVAADLSDVPFYRAHVHVDHARLALLNGNDAASARSLEVAADIYERLGAAGYLKRVNALRAAVHESSRVEDLGLSERERDIVTLLATGMSYVQIASALFVTRSTVSFHLGNIYAKANVGSRHELTQLAHQHPAAFGLAARA